jgi:hypothetical protein
VSFGADAVQRAAFFVSALASPDFAYKLKVSGILKNVPYQVLENQPFGWYGYSSYSGALDDEHS